MDVSNTQCLEEFSHSTVRCEDVFTKSMAYIKYEDHNNEEEQGALKL